MGRSEAHGMPVFASRAKVGVVDGKTIVRFVPTTETGPDTLELKRSDSGGGFTCDFAPVLGALGVRRLSRSFRARMERSEDSRLGKSIGLVLGTDLRELPRKRSGRKAAARKETEQQAAAGQQS